MLRRGRALWACWLALLIASSCEDGDAQVLPSLERDPPSTTTTRERPAEAEIVLVDAGLVEPADAAEGDAGHAGDAGDVADAVDEDLGPADAVGHSEREGADDGRLREDQVFDDTSAFGTRSPQADVRQESAGEPPPRGARLPPGAPLMPPSGLDYGSLFAGHTFDVASLSGGYTTVVMKKVALRLDDDINLFVVSLSGVLVPLELGLVNLDEPGSVELIVDEAEVRISQDDLERLFTRYLFDDDEDDDDVFGGRSGGGGFSGEAPLRDVSVSLQKGRLELRGTLQDGDKIVVTGTLEPTSGGDIALHPTSLRRDGKPVARLDDIFEGGLANAGLGLQDHGAGERAGAVGPSLWLEEEVVVFEPEAILPVPALIADVVDVKTEGGHVRLLLEGPAPKVKTLGPGEEIDNYLALRGGALRFGKLVMQRADLLFIDEDPEDPLDLSLREYDQQMVAGRTEVRADLGLRVTLPDYDEVGSGTLDDVEEAAGDDVFE